MHETSFNFFKNSSKDITGIGSNLDRLIINCYYFMLKLCPVIIVLGSLRKEFLFLGNMMEDLKINSKMSTAHSGVYVCTYERVYMHTYRG